MNDIYLIRHSLKMRGPVSGAFSAFDLMQPLSAEGEERARMLLDMSELRGADFALASNMSRSLATIRYILEADGVPYAIDERLRELGFGIRPEGVSMDEFMEHRWKVPEMVPEGGESVLQCRKRMWDAISEAAEAHPGEKLLIGSHGAAITAFLGGVLEDLGDGFTRGINLPDVFHLTYEDGKFTYRRRLEMPFPLPPMPKMPPEMK